MSNPSVVNSSFESGYTGSTYTYITPEGTANYSVNNNPPGWNSGRTQTHGGVIHVRNGNLPWGGLDSNEGNYYISLQRKDAYIEQTLSLVQGYVYNVTVKAARRSHGGDSLLIKIDGSTITTINASYSPGLGNNAFQDFTSANFTAASSSPVLRLQFDHSSYDGNVAVFVDNIGINYVSGIVSSVNSPADVSSGIVSWYDGDSFDTLNKKWTDKAGTFDLSSDYINGNIDKKNHLSNAILISKRNSKNYHQSYFSYLSGSENTGISFNKDSSYQFLTDVSYTFFHVARRDPSDNTQTGRVFDGSGANWYSGFSDASSGVAAHVNDSITTTDKQYGSNWVISVDTPKYYRSVGYSDTSSGYYDISSGNRNNTNTTTPQISINYGDTTYQGSTQRCDWNVAEVISYSRILDIAEENTVLDYLKSRYLGTNQSRTGNLYQLVGEISANSLVRGLAPELEPHNNIIGRYIPESYDANGYWRDVSPFKNDLSSCGTTPQYVAHDTTYKWLSYIKGSKGNTYADASGYKFPENFLPIDGSYTLIHVSRRTSSTGRIFDSASNKNFYSGFVGTKTGVALHSIDVSAANELSSGGGGGGGSPAIAFRAFDSPTNLNTGHFVTSSNSSESTGFTSSNTILPSTSSYSAFAGATNFSSITDGISVLASGIYRLKTNVQITGNAIRGNLCVGFEINSQSFNSNNIVNPIASSFYVRNSDGHNTTSGYTAGIYNLSADDNVKVLAEREAASGTLTLEPSNSYMEIVKINTPCAIRSHGSQQSFNLNSTDSGITVPMNGTLHEFNGSGNYTTVSNGIKVNSNGIYKISFNMFIQATGNSSTRLNFKMRFQKNNNDLQPNSAETSSFYIRDYASINEMSSGYVSQYVSLTAGDELTILSQRETNFGHHVKMWHLTNSNKYSSFMDIEKITDPVITCYGKEIGYNTDNANNSVNINNTTETTIDFDSNHINEYNGTGNFTSYNGGVTVNSSGVYILSTNIAGYSTNSRTNLLINFYRDGTPISGQTASTYVRYDSGHYYSSAYLSRTVQLSGSETIYVKSKKEAKDGNVYLVPRKSVLEIRKIS